MGYKKIILGIIASSIFIVLIFLHLAPVSFDAFACSGGYKTFVMEKYSKELIDMFFVEKGFEKDKIYELVSKKDENAVGWNGRNIYARLKIEVDEKVYTVDYIGKRYWIEKYSWKISKII